jgi:FtsH-binding integral membrane protein
VKNTTITQETRDIIRQGTNLIFSLAQFLVTLLPVLGIGTGIGSRAMGGVPYVQPIFWSFFIWFLIYAACIAYGIYQALPAQRENDILRHAGLYTASAFIGVTVYALVAQFGGSDWILIAIFIWILVSLLYAIIRLTEDRSRLTPTEEYTVLAPVSLLTGWVSLAIFVNFAAALKASGMLPDGTVETTFSVILLLIAGGVVSGIIYKTKGNIWYTFPVIWGLIGVIIANIWQQLKGVVAGTAALVALILIGILVVMRRREQEKSGRNKRILVLTR